MSSCLDYSKQVSTIQHPTKLLFDFSATVLAAGEIDQP